MFTSTHNPYVNHLTELYKIQKWLTENIPITIDPVKTDKLKYRLEWIEENIKQINLMIEDGLFAGL